MSVEQAPLLPLSRPDWVARIDEMCESRRYARMSDVEWSRIERDFPGLNLLSHAEDFAGYWESKRKKPRFYTFLRFRTWLRNLTKFGYVEAPTKRTPVADFTTSDLTDRYRS